MLAGAAGNNRFALELYAQLRGSNGNVIVSPFNVAEALAMVERGTSGETSRELRNVIHSDLPRARSGVAWKALLADVDRSGVVSATALWSNGSVLRKEYVADVKENFGATAQTLDFANANAAASRMNAWVAYKTRNNIRSLISPASLSKDTRAVLTAAIWMKAAWRTRFVRGETRERLFHLSGGRDVNVPTMQQTTYLRFAKAPGVRLLELPYAAPGLTMLVVLPDARFGLGAVEASLSAAAINRWTKALNDVELDLKFPRFTAASTFALTTPLQRLGVRRLFDRTRGAELSGMTTAAAPLAVSEVVHVARIIVDEEGTEASAATYDSTVAGTMPPPPPEPFIVDHPFLCIIRSGEQILFIGRVVDPRS